MLTLTRKIIPVTEWKGCYRQRWQGRIVPDAFVHPAKMARGLLVRIYNYLLENELIHVGETVFDPFMGIGTTAIEGACRGIRVIGVELEPKFVELARDNIQQYQAFWTEMGYPLPVIVQGDSRKLRQVLDIAGVDVTISSPPYAEIAAGAGGLNTKPPQHPGQQSGRSAESASQDTDQRYGETDGQLARMAKGTVDAVIGGPPSQDSDQDWHGGLKRINHTLGVRAGMKNDGIGINRRWGASPGNICHESGDTFWMAAQQVVQETYAILKPGGVAVWIVKAFVRDHTLIDFPNDWRKLCESVGFVTREEIHALLDYERMENGQLVTVTGKSFFRRVAEDHGAPPIDWETVWLMQKPYAQQRRGNLTWR